MINWIYELDRGIYSVEADFKFSFNMEKSYVDSVLLNNSIIITGRDSNEFCYKNIFDSKLIARINYEDLLLKEIEVLEGEIIIDGILISIGADITKTVEKLNSKGHKYFKHSYGYTFPELKIDLGDNYDNGGEERSICWIYTSDDITHLLENN